MKHVKHRLNHSTQVDHHLSLRKRAGKQEYGLIDRIVMFTGPLIPLAIFIQAHKVWINNETEGLSILTWSLMLVAAISMALYAIHHRTKPLMFIYIPLVLADLLIVLGILLHS